MSVDGSLFLAVGAIVTAILTLAGVIWTARARPSEAVKALADTVTTLRQENERMRERMQALEEAETKAALKAEALEREVDWLKAKIRDAERDRMELLAGVALLINQLRASGQTPLYEPKGK